MSLTDLLGSPVADGREDGGSLPKETCELPRPAFDPEPTEARRLLPAIALAGVVALVVGALFGWMMAERSTAEVPPPQAPAESTQLPVSVAATAELFTTLYLTGGNDLTTIFPGDSVATTGIWVNQTAAVATTITGDDTWAVTVAVDSLEHNGDTYLPAGLSYFVVPIAMQAGRPVAAGPPARVAMPRVTAPRDAFNATVTTEQAATVEAFLHEWLTGGSDTARYTATVNSVGVFDTAPYETVDALAGGADAAGRIVAAVTGSTAYGAVHHLEYVVSLAVEDDVWVVVAVGSRAG